MRLARPPQSKKVLGLNLAADEGLSVWSLPVWIPPGAQEPTFQIHADYVSWLLKIAYSYEWVFSSVLAL